MSGVEIRVKGFQLEAGSVQLILESCQARLVRLGTEVFGVNFGVERDELVV